MIYVTADDEEAVKHLVKNQNRAGASSTKDKAFSSLFAYSLSVCNFHGSLPINILFSNWVRHDEQFGVVWKIALDSRKGREKETREGSISQRIHPFIFLTTH